MQISAVPMAAPPPVSRKGRGEARMPTPGMLAPGQVGIGLGGSGTGSSTTGKESGTPAAPPAAVAVASLVAYRYSDSEDEG